MGMEERMVPKIYDPDPLTKCMGKDWLHNILHEDCTWTVVYQIEHFVMPNEIHETKPQIQSSEENLPDRNRLQVPEITIPSYPNAQTSDVTVSSRNDNNSDDSNGPENRATRRARGKSVYLTCFVGVDSIYFIIRLVIFLRVDVFHDANVDANKITVNDNSNNSSVRAHQTAVASDISNLEKYFCGIESLEAQCAWIFSVGWLCYFLANVSLIFSILWLSLILCYAYVFLKTLSLTINFIGLLTFGFKCLSTKFYVETGVFFIVHLPLQIFGTKRSKNFGVSLKRAQQEKLAAIMAASNTTIANESSSSIGRKAGKKAGPRLQRRMSYRMVTTVDV